MKKIFIGIDFSKEKFDATLIKAEGVKECGPSVHEVFDNKTSGYRRLVKWVRSQSEDAPADSLLYCGENTGGYSIGLSNYLYASGYDMWLESAYSIKQSSGIQRIKNDMYDSRIIAEYAMRNHDRMILYKPQSASLNSLREVFLYRHSLVRQRVALTNRRSEKRLTQEKSDVKAFMSFTSMPGIGAQNATCLMVYTDNFTKFDMNSRKIACYYGIAPFERRSGSSVYQKPQVSQFANRMIKSLLSQAALAAIKADVNICCYYQHLIERGKHPMLVHNNIKNKMLHTLVAMVRNKQKYNPEHLYKPVCGVA